MKLYWCIFQVCVMVEAAWKPLILVGGRVISVAGELEGKESLSPHHSYPAAIMLALFSALCTRT
jgi:hypothetical protein